MKSKIICTRCNGKKSLWETVNVIWNGVAVEIMTIGTTVNVTLIWNVLIAKEPVLLNKINPAVN